MIVNDKTVSWLKVISCYIWGYWGIWQLKYPWTWLYSMMSVELWISLLYVGRCSWGLVIPSLFSLSFGRNINYFLCGSIVSFIHELHLFKGHLNSWPVIRLWISLYFYLLKNIGDHISLYYKTKFRKFSDLC